ncbi:small integral membrane protein 13 [Lucilia sericata]|uniref:small integral membrane protein 13 n=1 Tax=Lucilia sericata TaxID=13632 RepID=UPI0018A81F10|nr:small integral membrane protein 13 [Lucilia sericata]
MSIASTLALILTVLASVSIVSVIILLGWFLIWKAFLSKFRLVRELLGQTNADGTPHSNGESTSLTSSSLSTQNKLKKLRKD